VIKEKKMKQFIKCRFYGKSDRVEYLGGMNWFCNARCYYNYRHMDDDSWALEQMCFQEKN